MKRRSLLLTGLVASVVASCGGAPRTQQRSMVDYILVEKRKRKMHLYSGKKKVKTYNIALGFNPVGHKQFEGDGKTPEGRYKIWTKNPRSAFHLSLGVSYPNRDDYNFARARGLSAGGDIFIHGGPNTREQAAKRDWTAGCIAVSDKEIEEIFSIVSTGAIIDIKA